jgi:hypothetical protein
VTTWLFSPIRTGPPLPFVVDHDLALPWPTMDTISSRYDRRRNLHQTVSVHSITVSTLTCRTHDNPQPTTKLDPCIVFFLVSSEVLGILTPVMDNEMKRIVFLDPIGSQFGCASFAGKPAWSFCDSIGVAVCFLLYDYALQVERSSNQAKQCFHHAALSLCVMSCVVAFVMSLKDSPRSSIWDAVVQTLRRA